MKSLIGSPVANVFWLIVIVKLGAGSIFAEDVGQRWGTEEREREYYPIVNIRCPKTPSSKRCVRSDADGRIAVARGVVKSISSMASIAPKLIQLSTALLRSRRDLWIDWQDNAFRVTQSCELTRVSDANNDGVADRFETISDAWGYANYHEYAFGSKLDANGNQFCLWAFRLLIIRML